MARKAMKMVDKPSQRIPAVPKGMVYWNTTKISQGLNNGTNNNAMARDMARSKGVNVSVERGSNSVPVFLNTIDSTTGIGTTHSLSIREPIVERVPSSPDDVEIIIQPSSGGVIGRYASHSTIGEDATSVSSVHGVVTAEETSQRRIDTERFMTTHPELHLTYREARNYVIAAELRQPKIDAARRSAKAARQRRNRAAKRSSI